MAMLNMYSKNLNFSSTIFDALVKNVIVPFLQRKGKLVMAFLRQYRK